MPPKPLDLMKHCGLNITEDFVWYLPVCICNSSHQVEIIWSARMAHGSKHHQIILRSRHQVCRDLIKFWKNFQKIFLWFLKQYNFLKTTYISCVNVIKINMFALYFFLIFICSNYSDFYYATISRIACMCVYIIIYLWHFLLICCISNVSACKDNLDSFINMEPGTGLGVVMSLKQLVNRFYRPNVNTQAPTPPQPQATAT